ncbi:NAD-dependent epimerase/dehydratase family protein [Haladaptatus halobius]|uniref:NAD-dependent epimerase/dehydratase family protein n=1 Tax=Haladaptatus halobius TaxID=2884875 RepID=UPI001D0AF93A|nr:NAD(P)-dependent oxidoreductase [Haladaptatus halobius]
MRVLVTGGCGYIGSVLVPELQEAIEIEEVVVLDSLETGSPRNLLGANVAEGFSFYRGDVCKYDDVENAMRNVDAVVHLAAITGAESTHSRPDETRSVNLEGMRNALNAARKLDVENFVYASSCNIYGRAGSMNLDEGVEPDPLTPYAETKVEAEELLRQYVDDYGFAGTALRMSTNYGYAPGMRFNLVANRFVFQALTDRPLTVYGDGTNWRPFIHVHDAARAYAHAVRNPASWPKTEYNVGVNGENYRISEIGKLVREETRTGTEITYLKDKNPGPSYHVNFDQLTETGFELSWSLRAGIVELIRRFRGFEAAPEVSVRG